MAGVMPKTALLLVRNGIVMGHFNCLSEIAYFVGISVSDEGVITFNGEKVNPSYNMKEDRASVLEGAWKDKHEVVVDWANHHMHLPSGCRVYRYLV